METPWSKLFPDPVFNGYTIPATLFTGSGAQQQMSSCEGRPWFQCQWDQTHQGGVGGGATGAGAPPAAYDWLQNIRGAGPTYTPAPPQPQINNELYDQRMAQLRGLLG